LYELINEADDEGKILELLDEEIRLVVIPKAGLNDELGTPE